MQIESHDLHHEFPEYRDAIHALKTGDAHFARLFGEYHDLDREVRRIETGAEHAGDRDLEDLKKRRLAHKDSLHRMLQAYTPAA